MKTILYATDFSEHADKAFSFAVALAQKHKAQLIMTHLYEVPETPATLYISDNPGMDSVMREEYILRLKNLFNIHATAKTELPAPEFLVEESISIVKDLITLIRKRNIDLLVIGTTGKSLPIELFSGSKAKQLIRQSPCPVLLVPSKSDAVEFSRTIYASDLMDNDVKALAGTMKILQPFQPQVTVVHITTANEYNGTIQLEWFRDMVKEQMPINDLTFREVRSDKIYESLNAFIRQEQPGLLVMLEKERTGFFDHLFHEDLVIKMESAASLPILSFSELSLSGTVSNARDDD